MNIMLKSLCFLGLLILPFWSYSQQEKDSLFLELEGLDRMLFERGFNQCDLNMLDSLVSEDFEFYHDQNGIQDKPMFMKTFRESICSSPQRKPIRKLVEGSLEIFPLYQNGHLYGAIQKGRHEFYIQEPGREMYKTSVAPFTNLWIIEEKAWKLKRVLSYDHQDPRSAGDKE